ncbi:MAG: lysylphosphatidylglycerol synthase transmembrane domain-containing protein [Planctomycetota bacterium]
MTDLTGDSPTPTPTSPPAPTAPTVARSPLMRVAVWTFRILTVALVVWIAMQVEIADSIVTTDSARGTLRGTIVQKGRPPSAAHAAQDWQIRVDDSNGASRVETVAWYEVARRDSLETADGHRAGGSLRIDPAAAASGVWPPAIAAGSTQQLWQEGGRVIDVVARDATALTVGRPMVTFGLASLAASLNAGTVAFALAAVLLTLFLCGARWWVLARSTGVNMRLTDAVRLMAIGQFYTYAPGGITTGDLVKAMYLRRKTQRTTEALVSVFADRLLGLQTMLSMGLVAVLIFGWELIETVPRFRLVMWASVALTIGVTLAGVVLMSKRLRGLLRVRHLMPARLAVVADEISSVLAPYRKARGAVAIAAALSLGSQTLQVLIAYAFGLALGIDVPLWQYFVLIPMGAVIGAIPGLPGGLGLMEGGYIAFFAFTLAPEELSRALALSLLMRLSLMLMSAIGLYEALTFGRRLTRERERGAGEPGTAVRAV